MWKTSVSDFSFFLKINFLFFFFVYRCTEVCCDRDVHVCEVVCGKTLNCGIQYVFDKNEKNNFNLIHFVCLVNVKNYVIKIFVENVQLIFMRN